MVGLDAVRHAMNPRYFLHDSTSVVEGSFTRHDKLDQLFMKLWHQQMHNSLLK
jgi:hypothetical protein